MSGASPATGAGTEPAKGRRGRSGRRKRDLSAPTEVSLEHARWRALAWAVIGLALGVLLLVKLGIVGKVVGLVLCVAALIPARSFVLTLLHEPGRIRVGEQDVTLPRGLCRAGPVTLPVDEVRHVYFLRRAVPWTRTGPLLVVETEARIFQYPRDWFATDSDQRRVAAALNHRLGRA